MLSKVRAARLWIAGMASLLFLLSSACGKEEEAAPTAAATAAPTKPAATAPAASPAATVPAAGSPTAAATTAAQPAIDYSKYGPVLAKYLENNSPLKYPVSKATPKRGGESNGAFPTPPNWDVTGPQNVATWSHGPLIYSSFVRPALNRGDNVITPAAKPDMMESWEQGKDGLSWTFKMRKGMTWQNRPPLNGRPVTIQDMKYAFDLIRTKYSFKVDYDVVTDVQVVDDQTLKLVLSRPYPDLLQAMLSMGMMVIAKECVENEECLKNKPVGAGPFMLESNEPGVKVVMVRNPNYYGKDAQGNQLPYLDRVTSWVFNDPAASTAAFRTGKLDMVYQYASVQGLNDILKTNPDAVVGILGAPRLYSMSINAMFMRWREGAPWNDPKVRLAMSMATDLQAQVTAHEGLATPGQPIPFDQLGMSFYPSFKDLEPYGKAWTYDPAAAKKLLAEAGYPNGFKVKVVNVTTSGYAWNSLLIWQQNWKAVGIDMEIVQSPDSASYYGLYMKAGWDDLIYQSNYNLGWTRPARAAYNTLHSKGANNWSKINDPKLDELLEKADLASTAEEKAGYLKQVLKLEGENPHYIYGVVPYRIEIMQPWIRGMSGSPEANVYGWGERTLIETWVDK